MFSMVQTVYDKLINQPVRTAAILRLPVGFAHL